jgi:hypothetical protein
LGKAFLKAAAATAKVAMARSLCRSKHADIMLLHVTA